MSGPLPVQRMLRRLLRPPSLIYAALMVRRRAGQVKLTDQTFPPCLSVGNISWGGTGKTPLVDWLLDWAAAHGLRAAVLTRGYRGRPASLPLAVQADTPVEQCGDEPLMLAQAHPEAQIVVDPKRRRAAAWLAKQGRSPDLLLLDDGFQHLAMPRAMDLVLLDKDDLADDARWNLVLPAGTWREGQSALATASALMLKIAPADWPDLAAKAQQRLAAYQKPLFCFDLIPQDLFDPKRKTAVDPRQIREYALACAVGNPLSFRDTASSFLGHEAREQLFYPDHCNLARHEQELGASGLPIVCTAKDAVKLEQTQLPQLYILRVKARFHANLFGRQDFEPWLNQRWREMAAY